MNLFRITKPKYAQDLSGTGAKLGGGRWNPKGKAVVYMAGSSALALLEHFTHLGRADLALIFQLILVETYQTPVRFYEDFFGKLPDNWKHDKTTSQQYGGQWIEKEYSPILRVPSVHSPWEYNYLINPDHPDCEVAIVEQAYYVYDNRLVKKDP